MVRCPEINKGQRAEALHYLTKLIADTMNADIVGFWRFNEDRSAIINECAYHQKTKGWAQGFILQKDAHPLYFDALSEERLVAVEDCSKDPVTKDFRESYLRKFGINALLDSPIFIDGEMVGILCCEMTTGTRVWSNEDKLFALSCADSIARVLENEQRKNFETKLKNQLSEENIKLNEAQLRTMVMSLPFAVALFDRELCLLAMSDIWARRYPFTDPQPLGKKIFETSLFLPLWIENMKKVLSGQEMGMDEQLVDLPKGQMWVMWRMLPWRNFEGGIDGLLLTYEDITARKEAEIHLRQTAKLTALGEMAGGIAHEINNPLSILKGFIDLMRRHIQRGNIDMPLFEQYMDRSYNTVDRISRIVRGMKRIARDSSQDDLQPYSVNALIEDALDFVQEKYREFGIDLVVNRLAPDVTVECRAVEISQVLLNLLNNSYHAVEGHEKAWIKISASLSETMAILIVEDSGPGVATNIQEKIFNPFFTTKDIGKGTGLGLSISRRIMEGHGGKLYLDTSSPHTSFVLEFPLRRTG